MIKKLLSPITFLLDKLYNFRIEFIFLTPREAKNFLAAHEARLKADLGEKRKTFSEAVLQLVHWRATKINNLYEVKLFVNRRALETKAGENVAVMDIALHIAKQLVERHQKSKASDEARKCPASKPPTGMLKENPPTILEVKK